MVGISKIVKWELTGLANKCINSGMTIAESVRYINANSPKGLNISKSSFTRYRNNYYMTQEKTIKASFNDDIANRINDIRNELIQAIEVVYRQLRLTYRDKTNCNKYFDRIIEELGRLSSLAETVKKEETEEWYHRWNRLGVEYGNFIQNYLKDRKVYDKDFLEKNKEVINRLEQTILN